MDEAVAQKIAIGVVRKAMRKQGVSYVELAERLTAIGTAETEKNLRNKISRGTFSASFLVLCLFVLNVPKPAFDEVDIDAWWGEKMRPELLREGSDVSVGEMLADLRALLDRHGVRDD